MAHVVMCKYPLCNRSFQSEAFMLQHFRDAHCAQLVQAGSKKKFPCKHCNRSFNIASGLLQHIETVHSKELMIGTKLQGITSSVAALLSLAARFFTWAWKNSTSGLQKVFKVSIAQLSKAGSLHWPPVRKHLSLALDFIFPPRRKFSVMAGRTWLCEHPSCNRSFESEAFMLQHFGDSHCPDLQAAASKRRSPCKRCNRSFESVAGLQQHIATVHLITELQLLRGSSSVADDDDDDDHVAPPILEQQMEVSCNDCGETFKSTASLHTHQWDSADHTRVSRTRMTNYGSGVRECSQCNAKFSTANDLEQHFMNLHPLSMVPEIDEHCTWIGMAGRFIAAWKNLTVDLHDIHGIFKVYNPGWRRKDFEEYRKELKEEFANKKLVKLGASEEDNEVRNDVLENGNELLRFHGTTVKCMLAGSGPAQGIINAGTSSSLCSDSGCSLCRILESGFKTSKCRVENFQRFGRGIYCSRTSSKANDYVRCLQQQGGAGGSSSSCCKVMMVCKVLAGRLHRSTHNLQHLTRPPTGFHSVQGDPGEVLNYDELVVYDDRAILPAYIILYTSD